MAVVSVRALLRDAAKVFEGVEQDKEPVLITRRGRPFAALVPVDPERAEAMILSSMPEFVESRRLAENAHAEGRTTPLAEVLRELDAEEAEPGDIHDESSTPAECVDTAQAESPDLALLVGSARAEEIDQIVRERVHTITINTLQGVAEADPVWLAQRRRGLERTLENLNSRMFNVRLRHELLRHLSQGIAVIHGTPGAGKSISRTEGLLGDALTDAVLGDTASFVDSVNARNIEVSMRAGRLSEDIFEARLEATVSALEKSDKERA